MKKNVNNNCLSRVKFKPGDSMFWYGISKLEKKFIDTSKNYQEWKKNAFLEDWRIGDVPL
jgi:hypothetical protein